MTVLRLRRLKGRARAAHMGKTADEMDWVTAAATLALALIVFGRSFLSHLPALRRPAHASFCTPRGSGQGCRGLIWACGL